MADASTQGPKLEFEGFANAPRDEDGKALDFRDVDPYVDESEAGKIRTASLTTESSLVQFRTEGPDTNGSPAASVGKSSVETATGTASSTTEGTDADADADAEPEIEQRNDAPEDPDSDAPTVADEDEVAAGGQEANEA